MRNCPDITILNILFEQKRWKIFAHICMTMSEKICVQGISQQTLQSLVDFIYTGRVSLCQDNVQVLVFSNQPEDIRHVSQDIFRHMFCRIS